MSATPPATPLEPNRAAFTAAFTALVTLSLLSIWLPALVPGQDTPDHMFSAAVLARPEMFPDYRAHFAPTSQLFVYLAALVNPLGPAVAAKLVRTFSLLLLLCGTSMAASERGIRRGPGLLLATAVAHTFVTAMGFENFALALSLGAVSFGLTFRAFKRGGIWWLALSLSLVLLGLAHAIVAGMVGLQLLLLALFHAGSRRRRLGGLILAGLPGLFWVVFSLWVSYAAQADMGTVAGLGTQRLSMWEQAQNLVLCSFGGFSMFGLPVVLASFSLLLLSPSKPASDDPTDRRLGVVSCALWLMFYFALPFHAAGWAFAQPRVLSILVLLPCLLAGWWRRPNLECLLIVACLAPYLVTTTLEAQGQAQSIQRELAAMGLDDVDTDVGIGVGQLSTGRTMHVTWSVVSAPSSRFVKPTFRAGAYVVAHAGGALPGLPTFNSGIHAALLQPPRAAWPPTPPQFIYRALDCDFNSDCAGAAAALPDRIAWQGVAYDTLLLSNAPQDVAAHLISRGFVREAPSRFVPRPSALQVTLALSVDAAQRPTTVRVGYPATIGWIQAQCREAGPGEASTLIEFGGLPAGPMTIEVVEHQTPDCDYSESAPLHLRARDIVELAPGNTLSLSLWL